MCVVYVHVCNTCRKQWSKSGVSSLTLHFGLFLRWGPLTETGAHRLARLAAQKAPESSSSFFSALGVGKHHHLWIFTGMLQNQSKSSCLGSRHLTKKAIPLNPSTWILEEEKLRRTYFNQPHEILRAHHTTDICSCHRQGHVLWRDALITGDETDSLGGELSRCKQARIMQLLLSHVWCFCVLASILTVLFLLDSEFIPIAIGCDALQAGTVTGRASLLTNADTLWLSNL